MPKSHCCEIVIAMKSCGAHPHSNMHIWRGQLGRTPPKSAGST